MLVRLKISQYALRCNVRNCPGVQSKGTCSSLMNTERGCRHIQRAISGCANCVFIHASSSGKISSFIVVSCLLQDTKFGHKLFENQLIKLTFNAQEKGDRSRPFHDTAVFRNLLNLERSGRAMKRNAPTRSGKQFFKKPASVALVLM